MEIFKNEPLIDCSYLESSNWFSEEINKWKSQFPIKVPSVVGGKEITSGKFLQSFNPSNKSEKINDYLLSTNELAQQAIDKCVADNEWKNFEPEVRAQYLVKVAEIMKQNKKSLTALMVLEVGKSWRESDADVCEAIDFCLYYAQKYLQIVKGSKMGDDPGEYNYYGYRQKGLSVIIAPWNFPLAILCGMAVAPLVCGNPVILKPAEQSSLIGYEFFKILLEAGIPNSVIHFIPGLGEQVGEYLVNHPKTHIVNFTGSRAVGLHIIKTAAEIKPGQRHIKKVIAEMGGKNFIYVDEDADLDEAVSGAVHAAFGFQGQKCSACSRLLVHESCYEKFKQRFILAMESMVWGQSEDVAAKMGPVIDQESYARVNEVLTRNSKYIIAQASLPKDLKDMGYYIPATIFESTDFNSELGQQEFFAPLVTLFKVNNLQQAFAAADDVDYGLTGGIYSRSPKNIQEAKKIMAVGNFYVNRPITGALVYKQPFGGSKLSGVGGKAGGPDYLLNFLEPYTISENTMRRGFAPEV